MFTKVHAYCTYLELAVDYSYAGPGNGLVSSGKQSTGRLGASVESKAWPEQEQSWLLAIPPCRDLLKITRSR